MSVGNHSIATGETFREPSTALRRPRCLLHEDSVNVLLQNVLPPLAATPF